MNRESYINANSKLIEKDGLKMLPHTHLNKVSLINSTAIRVQQLSLVPVEFHLYFWRTMWYKLGIKSKFSTAF